MTVTPNYQFLEKKKVTIPANTVDKIERSAVFFRACGISPNKAAASRVPEA